MRDQDIVNVLNEALQSDKEAVTKLINHRVKVNDELVSHPTITVTTDLELGLLGILNGITDFTISIVEDDDGNILEFKGKGMHDPMRFKWFVHNEEDKIVGCTESIAPFKNSIIEVNDRDYKIIDIDKNRHVLTVKELV